MRFDDLADHSLLDNRVAARTEARAEEQIGDIAAAAACAIQIVSRLPIAGDLTLDRDLCVLAVLTLDRAIAVVKDQLDRCLADRLARVGAGEDHVGQRIAAQAAGRALTHHPADRVDDIGFAAAVRTNHADHVARQVQGGRVHEGLETGKFDGAQAHTRLRSTDCDSIRHGGFPTFRDRQRSDRHPLAGHAYR